MQRKARPNRGAKALQAWMDRNGVTQDLLVEQLHKAGLKKVGQASISGWLCGKMPKVPALVAIEHLTGIQVRLWAEPVTHPHSSRPAA